MGKTIHLNDKNKKDSLLLKILLGGPREFNFFGKKIRIIGRLYEFVKQREFFMEGHWDHFVKGFSEIDPKNEFNTRVIYYKFNSLSNDGKKSVAWKCSEIYAFNNQLKYSDFVDVVNSYYSHLEEPDFGDDVA